MYLIFRQLQFSRISCRVLLLACAVQLSTRVSDYLTVPRRSAAASSLVPPPLAAPFPAGVHVRIPTGSPEAVSSAVLSTEYSSTASQWIPVPFPNSWSSRCKREDLAGSLASVAAAPAVRLQVGARAGKVGEMRTGSAWIRRAPCVAHSPARSVGRCPVSAWARPGPRRLELPRGVGSATAACVAPGPSTPRRRGRCGRPSPPARTCGWRWGWRRGFVGPSMRRTGLPAAGVDHPAAG